MPGLCGYAYARDCLSSDTMDGTPEALQTISRALAGYGVTSFLATTMTAPYADLEKAIRNVVAVSRQGMDGASIVGIHLEGPWINPRYKGAQKEENIAVPKLEDVRRLHELADGLMKVVTIAPEQPEATEAIQWLKEQGSSFPPGMPAPASTRQGKPWRAASATSPTASMR